MHSLPPALLSAAYTYAAYRALSTKLLAEGRTTAADPRFNTPPMLGYTTLNQHRMQRLDHTPALEPATVAAAVSKADARPQTWLVLSESWCGDAAQNLPILNRVAEATTGRITLRVLLRDENLALMDAFLTNGGRAIPKLIALDTSTGAVLGTWGPRPAPVQALVLQWRAEGLPYEELNTRLHTWYAHDRTATLQAELRAALATWGE